MEVSESKVFSSSIKGKRQAAFTAQTCFAFIVKWGSTPLMY